LKLARRAAAAGGKSEFEDKVHHEFQDLLARYKVFEDKILNPKPEKDGGAEKYAKDYADIQKHSKDQKDAKEHKHEKSEKERKDIVNEGEGGVFQPTPSVPDPVLEQRVAALESVIGRLAHFIEGKARPDLRRGALRQEPQ
jgi:hypothetical protein